MNQVIFILFSRSFSQDQVQNQSNFVPWRTCVSPGDEGVNAHIWLNGDYSLNENNSMDGDTFYNIFQFYGFTPCGTVDSSQNIK